MEGGRQTNRHTNIWFYRLNRPRGRFKENVWRVESAAVTKVTWRFITILEHPRRKLAAAV